jgi:hypothetical protein
MRGGGAGQGFDFLQLSHQFQALNATMFYIPSCFQDVVAILLKIFDNILSRIYFISPAPIVAAVARIT